MKNKVNRKKNKNKWADHLTKQAKIENYPARSVYKLMEIQKKFKVIHKNSTVLDLGCAPGSWLIYAAETVGPGGRAIGIDLKEIKVKLPENAASFTGDILNLNNIFVVSGARGVKTILSDMAPATTGRKEIDSARSFDLCMAALQCAVKFLSMGGDFVCKIFQGPDFKRFEIAVKSNFKQYNIFKPGSCRKTSKEIYIIGKNKRTDSSQDD